MKTSTPVLSDCAVDTDTLDMLGDSLARYLADQCPFDARRQPPGRPAWWPGLGQQLDALAVAWPLDFGGAGAGMAGHARMLRALGGALVAEPYLSTVLLGAGALLRSASPDAAALLGSIRAGQTLLAWAHAEPHARHERLQIATQLVAQGDGWRLDGVKSMVYGAPWAGQLVVSACLEGAPVLVLVPRTAPGVTLRPYATMDGSAAAEVRLCQVALAPEALLIDPAQGASVIEALLDEATLGLCAEALGVLARLLRDSLDYARQRQQFGVAIASFQAIQHRLADMHMAFALAEALTTQTAAGFEALAPAARARAVSAAKVMVAKACQCVGQGAVQLHGGMGMTEELAVGHCFRRATLIAQQLGSPPWHLRRRAQLDAEETG